MKQIKFSMVLTLLAAAGAMQTYAQDISALPEVTILTRNYKYMRAMDDGAAQPVQTLELKAAMYNIKNSELYEDDFDNYYVTFRLPEGYLLAAYDQNGKILYTAEKYKNAALPKVVSSAVVQKFPGWIISNSTYKVNYESDKETAKMVYKLVLENGDERTRVKLNEKGEFL